MKPAALVPTNQTAHSLSPENTIIACILEHNDLALNFIEQIISSDPSIVRVEIADLKTITEGRAHKCVFILDDYGLTPSIHAYLKRMKQTFEKAKCIVLAKEASPPYVCELIALGLDGFLSYGDVATSLLPAIKAVVSNQLWINREIQQHFIKTDLRLGSIRDPHRDQILTAREREIVNLVQQRLNNREIAKLLGVQESTVKFHLTNIFLKLQVSSRRDIVGKSSQPTWPQLAA